MLRWIDKEEKQVDLVEGLARQLAGKDAFPIAIANILFQRGFDSFDRVREFLRPDREALHSPWGLKGMEEAVERIVRAVVSQEKVLIYGDYDVDGTTSVSLLKLFLKDWGIEADYYIPDRYKEGYGISFEGMHFAAQAGYQLVIALDCGTKALDKARFARMRGIDLIIVDHHTPGEELPLCEAMVNPFQAGCSYPDHALSACGLTLKLTQALNERFRTVVELTPPEAGYDPFDHYADLVTLSIACDLVPITGENRTIASFGIAKIKTAPLPGIAALMSLSEHERSWNIGDLVFFLGPRINSAGRLRHAKAAVQLLLGDPEERDEFAAALHRFNEERRNLDKAITDEALAMIKQDPQGAQRAATVLYQETWHKGVIGIVASRVVEHYHRPTILLTRDENNWVGSGRSVPGFDLYEAILACQEHTVRFGGHKYAAGITLRDEQLSEFEKEFERIVAERITPEQKIPILEIAHRIHFKDITPKFIQMLQLLAPFGPGNPEPVFLTEEVTVQDYRILKKDHIRLTLFKDGIRFEAIGFNLAERWHEVNSINLHVAFQPGIKTWRGRSFVQLRLKDFKAV